MRKPLLLFLFCSLFGTVSRAQNANHTVVISNLENRKGDLYIGWYNSDSLFMNEEKVTFKKVVPLNGNKQVSVAFEDVHPGTYAIALFIDVNGNGKLDKNFMGIPREKYGFSNNVYPSHRAATFQEASFKTGSKPETISIKMK